MDYPKRRIRVYKQQGDDVTVELLRIPENGQLAVHGARDWRRVYELAQEYGIPPELIEVDPDAEEFLGQRPPG